MISAQSAAWRLSELQLSWLPPSGATVTQFLQDGHRLSNGLSIGVTLWLFAMEAMAHW